MNTANLARLKEGVEAWNKWRIINQYSTPDLRIPDLRIPDLSNADLREVNLRGANLREVNLRGANLSEVNLRGADLHAADLRDANLSGANLSEVNLRGTNLCDADLRNTNLSEVNLSEVNLRGADLRGANLRGADLRGTNLCDADLRNINLSEVNLRGAKVNTNSLYGVDVARIPRSQRPTVKEDVLKFEVVIYVSEDIEWKEEELLVAAVDEFMSTCGFEMESELEPLRSSYFKQLWFKAKKPLTRKEATEAFEKGKTALQSKYLDLPEAEVTQKYVDATAKLIKATENLDEFSTILGGLIFVKVTTRGVPYVRAETLTPELARMLAKNPELRNNPTRLIEEIEKVAEETDTPAEDAPPPGDSLTERHAKRITEMYFPQTCQTLRVDCV